MLIVRQTYRVLEEPKKDDWTRIVNGYDAKPRGWMVMIRLNDLVSLSFSLERDAGHF